MSKNIKGVLEGEEEYAASQSRAEVRFRSRSGNVRFSRFNICATLQ
jgi:hypothetical protein